MKRTTNKVVEVIANIKIILIRVCVGFMNSLKCKMEQILSDFKLFWNSTIVITE